jgi:asparagine N-glycosylation enzyme membrane subunit Stt3
VVTADRQRAKLVGYVLHFVAGFLFSLAYYVGFAGLGRSGWLLGAGFGVIHGLFAMTALVNILLPVIHPRMGDALSSVDSAALLEAPGFLMLNYGRATPLVNLVAHAAYGTIVGGFESLAD